MPEKSAARDSKQDNDLTSSRFFREANVVSGMPKTATTLPKKIENRLNILICLKIKIAYRDTTS